MAEKISRSDIEWLVQYPSKSTAPSYELPTVNSSKGHVEHVFTLQREIASVAVESAVDPMKPSDVSQPTSSTQSSSTVAVGHPAFARSPAVLSINTRTPEDNVRYMPQPAGDHDADHEIEYLRPTRYKIKRSDWHTVWYSSCSPDPPQHPTRIHPEEVLRAGDLYIHRSSGVGNRLMWVFTSDGRWESVSPLEERAHPVLKHLVLSFSSSGNPTWVRPETAKRHGNFSDVWDDLETDE
ncbi:hypothetical protein FOMPIDRAFT_91089 [Fomitopsis schrenkii]|uniref:Uncharacterized protein n=1 Tax=Fomitopsis schrenkii TaxID=2126942 RepID=S8E9K7_FOMSC|nr:hypothetical protein FOMPIDRAFT_91089 [Fomitopsis schrenkii]